MKHFLLTFLGANLFVIFIDLLRIYSPLDSVIPLAMVVGLQSVRQGDSIGIGFTVR